MLSTGGTPATRRRALNLPDAGQGRGGWQSADLRTVAAGRSGAAAVRPALRSSVRPVRRAGGWQTPGLAESRAIPRQAINTGTPAPSRDGTAQGSRQTSGPHTCPVAVIADRDRTLWPASTHGRPPPPGRVIRAAQIAHELRKPLHSGRFSFPTGTAPSPAITAP
jgi:hypothetical protein